jgi:hypothetical protein
MTLISIKGLGPMLGAIYTLLIQRSQVQHSNSLKTFASQLTDLSVWAPADTQPPPIHQNGAEHNPWAPDKGRLWSGTISSIVNKFFRRFEVNCYTIILSNWETCDKDYLVYQTFFILGKKYLFFIVIDIICNLLFCFKTIKIVLKSRFNIKRYLRKKKH